MHDKPQTFPNVVDKIIVHILVLYGVAICVRSFEFTTGKRYHVQHIGIGQFINNNGQMVDQSTS